MITIISIHMDPKSTMPLAISRELAALFRAELLLLFLVQHGDSTYMLPFGVQHYMLHGRPA
jgi:hypothetical protein